MNDSELSDSRMFPRTQNFWLLYSRINLIWHLWTRQYLYWTNSLKSNFLLLLLYWAAELSRVVFHLYVICRCWCFKFCSQPSKNVQLSVTSVSSQNDRTFLTITGSKMGFPSECITVNCLYNTLFILCYFRLIHVFHLKWFFTFSLDATNCCIWSFCFFIL